MFELENTTKTMEFSEVQTMADLLIARDEFAKKLVKKYLKTMPAEEVINQYGPEDRLKGLKPEDVLQQYQPAERRELLRLLQADQE